MARVLEVVRNVGALTDGLQGEDSLTALSISLSGEYQLRRILCALMLLSFVISACGGLSPETSATPEIKGQNCGTVLMLGPNAPQDAAALQAETCFAHAFQPCSIATLVVRVMGVDAGVIHTFTLDNKDGKCTLTDTSITYNVSLRSQVVKTYTCASLEQSPNGLLFKSCGDLGDISVPAPK